MRCVLNTINRNPIEISQVQAQEFLATIPEDASGAVKYRITFDGQKLTAAKVIPASGEKISEFFSNIKKVFSGFLVKNWVSKSAMNIKYTMLLQSF